MINFNCKNLHFNCKNGKLFSEQFVFHSLQMLVFSSHGIILSIITCRTIPFGFAAIFVFMLLYFFSSVNLLATSFIGLHIIV